ncbi:MAG: CHAD domain-containing protein [Myxococcota bacterium]
MEEVELKLIAGPSFDPAALQERLASIGTIAASKSFKQRDDYLDTPAAELVTLGLSARVRSKEKGQTVDVKPVPIAADLVMRRSELSAPVSKKGDPGRTLRKLLARMLGVALDGTAAVVLSIETQRVLHELEIDDSRVEVCFDTVRVLDADGNEGGRFVEIEAELAAGDEVVLHRIGEVFSALDLSPSGKSKYVRARGLLGLPAYRWGVDAPSFDLDTDIAQVARAVCRQQLQLVRNYEPGTRIGLDTEHLHKMRVATRRLRTALRVFEDAFSGTERRAMNRGFRWLGRRLGAVRDLDVAVLALPSWRRRFGPEPVEGWDGLAERLDVRRTRARRDLIDALDSTRWAELAETADEVFEADDEARGALRGSIRALLDLRLTAFEDGVATFTRTQSLEDAHELRILGKRLRYTVEFVRPALDIDTKPMLKRLSTFQDELGALQDAAEAGAFALREFEEDGDPATAFALGTLRGSARLEAEQARGRVDAALAALDAGTLIEGLRKALPPA